MEDGDYVFMDTTSYEQIRLLGATLEHVAGFMKDNIEVDVLFHNGNPISVDLPTFIEATIVQVDPGFKGDTVQGGTKPATIESGAVIQVPLYIKQGELIRIDTRTSEYVERVNK
jgi:elongation factor P